MSKFDWKKEIDDAISKEPLLKEGFIRRVQQPKKQRKFVFIPSIAILLLIVTAFLLIPKEKQQQATEPGAVSVLEEPLMQYFEAIEQEDYAKLQQVSTTETTASPKEIIQHYEGLQPLDYRILKQTEHGAVAVLMLQIPAKQGEDSFVRNYTINKEQGTVSEEIYAEPQVYKVFEHPETIALSFGPASVVEQADLPTVAPTDERILRNGDRVLRYDQEQTASIYIESTRGTFHVGDIMKADTWFAEFMPNIEEEILMIGTPESMMYVYFNEEMGMYQRLIGERTEANSIASHTIEQFENPIFVVRMGGDTIVGTVENGQLIVSPINLAIKLELYQQQLVEIEVVGSAFLLKYTEEYEQQSSYYTFSTNRELIKN